MLPNTRHYRVVSRSKHPHTSEYSLWTECSRVFCIALSAGLLGIILGFALSRNK